MTQRNYISQFMQQHQYTSIIPIDKLKLGFKYPPRILMCPPFTNLKANVPAFLDDDSLHKYDQLIKNIKEYAEINKLKLKSDNNQTNSFSKHRPPVNNIIKVRFDFTRGLNIFIRKREEPSRTKCVTVNSLDEYTQFFSKYNHLMNMSLDSLDDDDIEIITSRESINQREYRHIDKLHGIILVNMFQHVDGTVHLEFNLQQLLVIEHVSIFNTYHNENKLSTA